MLKSYASNPIYLSGSGLCSGPFPAHMTRMAKAFWKTSVILASVLFWAGASGAATLRVPENFRSIQEAVNAALPGDEIIVGQGLYKENVLVTKPLVLKSSAGPSMTMVQALDENQPSIKVDGVQDVTVSGFSATDSLVAGVLLSNSRNIVLTASQFTGNFNGIVANGVTDSAITGNISNSNSQYGLYLEKSHNNRIVENTASLNKDKGFFISNSKGNTITGNSVNLNTWDGLMLYASTGNTVVDNKVLRNTYGIVISESVGNEVDRNMTLPNLFLIMPIVLVYLGIMSYLIQKNILKAVYKE